MNRAVFIIWCILLLFAPSPGIAQDDADRARHLRQVSQKAEAYAAEGAWDKSVEILTAELNALPDGRRMNSYRAFLHFNLGYIYSTRTGEDREANIDRAIAHYKRALAYEPDDGHSLRNLVLLLQERGAWEESIEFLQQGIRKDKDNAGTYYAALGDAYRKMGDLAGAWKAYSKSIASENPEPSSRIKLIDLYDAYPHSAFDRLFEQCIAFREAGDYEMARLGLLALIRQICAAEAAYDNAFPTIEDILMTWIGVVVERGWGGPHLIRDLKVECQVRPVEDLKAALNLWVGTDDPLLWLRSSDWWAADERRRFYLIALQKGFADAMLSGTKTGRITRAVELYEAILDYLLETRSDFSEELFGSQDALVTDVIVRLMKIYNSPLEENERKFKTLESRLFDMKGSAYRARDLEQIQKFHTILALIYVDRQEWDGFGAKNAMFQLSRAVETAQERYAEDPDTYYPIPVLQKHLADVLAANGRLAPAYDVYTDAAIAYLDTDNLKLARRMLSKAAQLESAAGQADREKYAAALSIYSARRQVALLDRQNFEKGGARFYREQAEFDWLDDPRKVRQIDQDIVERQRFRVIADLQQRAQTVGAQEASEDLRKEARREVSTKNVYLEQDVGRIQRLDLPKTQVQRPGGVQYLQPEAAEQVKTDVIKLATPAGDVKRRVPVRKND